MDEERDWLVTFAHRVATERAYSARHPGHVFLVMLHEGEAEGMLSQVNEIVQKLAEAQKALTPKAREKVGAERSSAA